MSPLHQRGYDCIREYLAAARMRHSEARRLLERSHDLGAIYLYGYSVEMRVKAAYFHNAGLLREELITQQHRTDAVNMWTILGLATPPRPHDIAGWATLAVAARSTAPSPLRPYEGAFGIEVVTRATSLYLIWRETLRYRSTQPLPRELRDVRSIADWFSSIEAKMI